MQGVEPGLIERQRPKIYLVVGDRSIKLGRPSMSLKRMHVILKAPH